MASSTNKTTGRETVPYVNKLDGVCKARYVDKLKIIGDKDPYEMRSEEWSTDVEAYPNIAYPDIVNYLVNSVSAYTLDQLKGYKPLEAYNYFVSGWVQDIRQSVQQNKCVLIARVKHSQRSTDPCLIPWVIAEKDGAVVAGHCTCMAGLGEICSHVAALLFAVEATVKLRDSKTVTQEKSYWLLPSAVKKVGYKTIQEINFTSAKTMKRKLDEALQTGDAPAPMPFRKLPEVNEPTDIELVYVNFIQR